MCSVRVRRLTAGFAEGKGHWGEFSSSLEQSELYTCPDTCHQTHVTCPGFVLKVPVAPAGGCCSNSQGPYAYIII